MTATATGVGLRPPNRQGSTTVRRRGFDNGGFGFDGNGSAAVRLRGFDNGGSGSATVSVRVRRRGSTAGRRRGNDRGQHGATTFNGGRQQFQALKAATGKQRKATRVQGIGNLRVCVGKTGLNTCGKTSGIVGGCGQTRKERGNVNTCTIYQ